jgi:ubiquinone/menaquinone biosynthesis C-methylase UbiE
MTVATHSLGPADVYDRSFVPALFGRWGPVVASAADVREGQRVLDVACGTGALTAAVVDLVGASGSVVGLDLNPEMLAVARRKPLPVEWVEAPAEALPFPDADFDAVVSQFGFMFFVDHVAALREMMRVLRPGGRLAVAVCDDVETSAGYGALARLLDRLFGTPVGDAFRAPFALGDAERLRALARDAGLPDADVRQHRGRVRFTSVEALVSAERACVWTLGGILDEDQFTRLLESAETELKPFASRDGSVDFDMPALVLTAGRAA